MIIKCTRQQWIDAASEVIRAKSVEHVCVEPLAKQLGVTKGSFYWHFKDQQDLLRAVVEQHTKASGALVSEEDTIKHLELHNSLMFACRYRDDIRSWIEKQHEDAA